ncbi:unnamed protein product [Phytomonas sp. Hart1]|nr:unnamed protein product [Phytomonas sp. Hart1]|eukprot:CCW69752.1 unnamed protein product [Phytomonas sp. isolate Hart1]
MDSEAESFKKTIPGGIEGMNSSVNDITEEPSSFDRDDIKSLVRVENDESKYDLTGAANVHPVMDSTPAIKYDKGSNELPKQKSTINNTTRDTPESKGLDVVVDMQGVGVPDRPESDIQHRRNFATKTISNPRDAGEGDANLDSEFPLFPSHSFNEQGHPSRTLGNFSSPLAEDLVEDYTRQQDINHKTNQEVPSDLVIGSPKSSSQFTMKIPPAPYQNLSPLLVSELSEVDLPMMRHPTSTSFPVTLLGVSTDLRRKRIKKVSHYIIGALLGEGTYGVVRDGLDISGERISRCAVKMGNVCTGSTTSAKDRPALKRTDQAAYQRRVNQREAINLQRFHSPYIVRARDIFTMNGKEYIILPIAICSLEQLVQDALREASAKRQHPRTHIGSSDGKEPNTQSGLSTGTTTKTAEMADSKTNLNVTYSNDVVDPDNRGFHQDETASTASYRSGSAKGYRGPWGGYHHDGDDPDEVNSPNNNEQLTLLSTLEDDSRSVSFSVTSCSSASTTSTTVCASFQTETPGEVGSNLPPRLVPILNDGSKSLLQHSSRDRKEPEPLLSMMLIRGIMFQILSGVNYLHLQNSAHNDIKTSNILLFEDGSVKLTDLGSVGERYDGYGTPLYAAPELCKHFYGLVDGNSNNYDNFSTMGEARSDSEHSSAWNRKWVPRRSGLLEIDAKKCDMWCCGLILYKLLTGKDGPLRVHQNYYNQRLKDSSSDYDDNSATPASLINCFQLYREIASQKEAVCLDDVPDLTVGIVETEQSSINGFPSKYPRNSVRGLLERLLAIEPEKRFTAEEALAHPWISSLLDLGQSFSRPEHLQNPPDNTRRKDLVRQSVEEAIRCSIAREVLRSSHVRKILKKDSENHLQFVADCCNILNVDIPEEVFRPFGTEPYENNYYSGLWEGAATPPPQSSSVVTTMMEADGRARDVVMGTLVRSNLPKVMPRGSVDPHLFLPFDEANYYERKSGKKGFDVRCLLGQPAKLRQLEAYLHNVVLVKCGYRIRPDPVFESPPCGVVGLLPILRQHLGGDVSGLHGTLSQAVAPTTVFRSSGSPRASEETTSSRSRLLAASHEDLNRGGICPPRQPTARDGDPRPRTAPQPQAARRWVGEQAGIATGVVVDSPPRSPGGRRRETSAQRGVADEDPSNINTQRVARMVYRGSGREGIEATAESSKCFCGLA